MFGRQNVHAMIASIGFRVKAEREKDPNTVIEAVMETPLDFALADEISPAMAKDLYLAGKDHTPKPEMQEAVFNIAPGKQLMVVRSHPELDPDFKVEGVTLRRISVKKSEDGSSWVLHYTASWVLGDVEAEAVGIIRLLKKGAYFTFETQQPDLLPEPEAQAADEAGDVLDEQAAKGSNVTDITAGRKRGGGKRRGKKQPEAEAQAQAAEGKKLAAGGDEPAEAGGEPAADDKIH